MELVIVIIIGLCFGSFLTVVAYRVPRKLSIIKPARSYCPQTNKTLSMKENIPLLSYLIQGGKSKHNGKAIPIVYPLIEIITTAFALATYFRFGFTPTGILIFTFLCSLIAISFIDLEFMIIPNVISLPGITIGLILGAISQYTNYFQYPITQGAMDSLIGFLLGGGLFWSIGAIYFLLTKREGLGGGDVKLLAMIGAIFGYNSIIPTILSASMLGVVFGVSTMLLKGGGRHSEIPFGPWLAVGIIIYIFGGTSLFPYAI